MGNWPFLKNKYAAWILLFVLLEIHRCCRCVAASWCWSTDLLSDGMQGCSNRERYNEHCD